MATIKDLVARLSADTTQFEQGLNGAVAQAEQASGSIIGSFAKVGAGIAAAGVGLAATGILAVGAAAFDMSTQIDQAGDHVGAALGDAADAGKNYEDVMKGVFSNNFGNDFDDIAQSVVQVEQNMRRVGGVSEQELQKLTEGAIAVRDVFGEDVTQTANAAATLMEEFGLTGEQAMDMIAQGFQNGLNSSGDFLDSINEYSVQFGNAGADASQFFSLMDSGLKGGMLGTDRAADAFKEFRVRILDGSQTTSDALEMIGLDAEEMTAAIDSGALTIADAFQLVTDKLAETEDQSILMQAGVGLIGTQFEDLGQEAILALDLTNDALAESEGAVDSLNKKYDNWPTLLEGVKRRVLIALTPIGDELLDIANSQMPRVEAALSWFESTLPGILDTAVDWIVDVEQGLAKVYDVIMVLTSGDTESNFTWWMSEDQIETIISIRDAVIDLSDGISEFFDSASNVGDTILTWLDDNGIEVTDIILGIGVAFGTFSVLSTVSGWIGTAAGAFSTLSTIIGASGGIIGTIVGILGGPLTIVLGAIALGVAGLYLAWQNDWGGMRDKLTEVWNVISPIFGQVKNWLITQIPVAVQATSDFWNNVLYPALNTVGVFIQDNIFPIFVTLGEWLAENLPTAISTLSEWWNTSLYPALHLIWEFIQDSIVPLFKALAEVILLALIVKVQELADKWNNEIMPALRLVWGFIQDNFNPSMDALKEAVMLMFPQMKTFIDFFSDLRGNLDAAASVIDTIIGYLGRLADGIRNLPSAPSWLGNLTGGGGGGGGSGNPGGNRALGGPIQPHKDYIVGEEGVEIFRSNTSGWIVPHHQTMDLLNQDQGQVVIQFQPVINTPVDLEEMYVELGRMARERRY